MQKQFLVPQFIDVEDKILGPITVRQFVIMLISVLFMFIEYQLAQFWLFIIEAIITFVIFAIIAFLKINGMPFHYFFLNLVQTTKRDKLRVWNKELTTAELKEYIKIDKQKVEKEVETIVPKQVSYSSLARLSLIVNTGGAYKGDNEFNLNDSNL